MAPPQERRSCRRGSGVPQGTPLLFVGALSPENLRASTSDSFEAKFFPSRMSRLRWERVRDDAKPRALPQLRWLHAGIVLRSEQRSTSHEAAEFSGFADE